MNSTVPIRFYLPSEQLVNEIPGTISAYWKWIHDHLPEMPALLPDSDEYCTSWGAYYWTIQSWIHLAANGVSAELVASLPKDGIVISHGDFLPARLRPSAGQYLVEIKPDRLPHCECANFFIVQNRRDPLLSGINRLLYRAAAVNFWPTPELMPRDPGRGDTFQNIRYFGNSEEFLADVPTLEAEIKKLGMNFAIVPAKQWNDFREVDAVLGCRPTSRSSRDAVANSPSRKPPSKLTNAWLAGTPAILSPEVAYEDLRKSEFDYLTACDIPEILARIRQLADDVELRKKMVENGKIRGVEYNVKSTVARWKEILAYRIFPDWEAWIRAPWKRAAHILLRRCASTVGFPTTS